MADWSKVTAEHVRRAIELFEKGEELPNPREKARNTFLIANGKEYDGKFIRQLAYRLATGEVCQGCNGGMETVNFFKDRGFETRYKTTSGGTSLRLLYDGFKDRYLAIRTPAGAESGQWNEAYKWRLLPPLAKEVFSTPITPENVRERTGILRKHLKNLADFRDFSGLMELPEDEAAGFLNLLKTIDEDTLAETMETQRTRLKALLTNKTRSLGAPLWGFLLAATDSARFPPFKDGVFQMLIEALGEKDEWRSSKPGQRYAQFREYCLQIGEWLQTENLPTFSSDGATVRPGLTALDGQDFLYIWAGQQQETSAEKSYWLFAPGRQAHRWDEFYKTGIMAIDFDLERDLSKYQSQEEYIPLLREAKGLDDEVSPTNRARVLYEFTHAMMPGDVVIAKRGTSHFLGWGVVTSEYQYDPDRADYRHVRKVEWKNKGEWEKGNLTINLQTLTDITDRDDLPAIKNLLGIDISFPFQRMDLPLNQILYGPPGTGKTYTLMTEYFPLFTEKQSASTADYVEKIAEDHPWWSVIAAVLLDLGEGHGNDIINHELMQAKLRGTSNQNPMSAIWNNMQNHTSLESKTVKTNVERRTEPFLFEKSADSVWTVDEKKVDEEAPEVRTLLKQYKNPPVDRIEKRYEFITFHQSYSYEEFIEGIRPETDESGNVIYKIRDGIFKRLVTRAKENPNKSYAIFIDEINRGNISKIFGELITLLEPDKRLGADNELTVRLPYSNEEFGVPKNLHVIGTLNTADRSIALIDLALRRRFEFRGLYPQYDILGLQYGELLRTLNKRIIEERGPDYQIGHSYFLARNGVFNLGEAMNKSILPLLNEYFYDDKETIKDMLSKAGVQTNEAMGQLTFGNYEPTENAKD